ncbi:MAG: hypothetical protein NUW21_13385 [Elusimicrobia bacterium]|nr:hypothetical protein [Elusimicrobiota bacterium]
MTIAALGIGGATLIGGAISAKGGYDQAQDAADGMQANARMARLAARDALQRGALESGQARMEGTKVIGQQKAAIGASGIDASSGSAVALMADTRVQSELDAVTIANNAAREAWGFRTQARQLDSQAKKTREASKWAVAGSLIGTAASGAGTAYSGFKGME